MKTLRILSLVVALIGLFAANVHAATAQATEAKVVKITGAATVTLPGQTEAVALTEGMSLPAGAVITTGAGAEVDVQPMAGTLTAIRENSSVSLDELSVMKNSDGVVTKQTAQISLKSGNVVSSLDPANKRINNYGVRTPKGVAAARGTVYTVTVSTTKNSTSVATLAGTVTLTPVGGGDPIIVDIGTGAILNADGTSTGGTLAHLIATETSGEMASAVSAAVTTVATAVQNGTTGTSSDKAIAALAAVVKVASQANPGSATTYVSQAVTVVTAAGSAVPATAAVSAAKAVAEAAAYGSGSADIFMAAEMAAYESARQGGVRVSEEILNDAVARGIFTNAGLDFDVISTPITPIDPTVISPSGGTQ